MKDDDPVQDVEAVGVELLHSFPRDLQRVSAVAALAGKRVAAGALFAVLALWCAPLAQAQQQPAPAQPASAAPAVPPVPSNVTAAKAYAALERNCAGCHQAGHPASQAQPAARDPALALDAILDLESLAASRWLVRPRMPDASLIYNVALTGERHTAIWSDPARAEPGSDEVQAIRDWIEDLPAEPRGGCAADAGMTAGQLSVTLSRAVAAMPPETARLTRFISLAHLANACFSARLIERVQAELSAIAGGASPKPAGAARILEPVDERRLVWRLYMPAFGMNAEQWDRWSAGNPMSRAPGLVISPDVLAGTGSNRPVVPAEWLGAASGAPRPAPFALAISGEALALAIRRPATSADLAAELWLRPSDIASRLSNPPPELSLPARRLIGGNAVSRAEFERIGAFLRTGLGQDAAANSSDGQKPDTPFAVALSADKAVYAAGETATFRVEASADCYVTLIGVDRVGRATVLYPSEFEPANRLAKGTVLQVPAPGAPYRFRFKDKGRETIVAICSQTNKAPVGLVHDYERLRFTVIGDWQLFLREPSAMNEARRDDAATDTPRPQARQPRRRGRAPDPKAAPAPEHDIQTRTAIAISIE